LVITFQLTNLTSHNFVYLNTDTTCVTLKIKEMNSRISLVLRAKNISPAQLADELGVQRSGISHILNGRNKPSLDFIQKLLKCYPDISMSWLMFGTGPMMNPYPVKEDTFNENKSTINAQASLIDLFPIPGDVEDKDSILGQSELIKTDDILIEIEQVIPTRKNEQENVQKSLETENETGVKDYPPSTPEKKYDAKSKAVNGKNITRIVIFYNDKTFTEYFPEPE
jgi:transcriptional regulator with XRE-family HTH domain